MAYRLYKREHCLSTATMFEVKQFRPSLLNGLFITGERLNLKAALARTYFWLITKGKAEIFYIESANKVVLHTSYVLPKCYKFSFMRKTDYEIGPCNTIESARGRGLYSTTLKYIISNKQYENACFWMLVSEENKPSIMGIEKAQFSLDGYAGKTSVLKRYYRIGDL